MTSRLQAILVSEWTAAPLSAWRWWRDELLDMLPGKVRTTLLARLRPSAVDLIDDETDVAGGLDADAPAASRAQGGLQARERSTRQSATAPMPRDAVVHLRLPPQDVLRREIDLPLAAGRDLREILRFEVERLCPLDSADISWDWRVVGRSRARNKLHVEVWFVKKDTVARALRFCAARQLSPASLGIIGEHDDVAVTRLLPRGVEPLGRRMGRFLVPGLMALALLLAVLLLNVEYDRRQSGVDRLRAHVAEAKTAAQAAERLRTEIPQASARANFPADRKQEPLAVGVLTDVTRHLPDDAWLIQLELAGREVRIQGFAPKASALIEVFGHSPVFGNPQFRAPVTRGATGRAKSDVERFDLSFELRRRP